MFESLFKIEKKWGESRWAQIAGIILFIAVIVGALLYKF